MTRYLICYYYRDDWDATLDHESCVTIPANSEDEAVAKFREDYGLSHSISYILEDK